MPSEAAFKVLDLLAGLIGGLAIAGFAVAGFAVAIVAALRTPVLTRLARLEAYPGSP